MRQKIQCAILWLAVLSLVGNAGAGEVVDRIVASVNQQVVLESELQVSIAYQCLANHSSCLPLGSAERDAALNRLIEQKLLQQQMRDAQPQFNMQKVAQRVEELKEELTSGGKKKEDLQGLWMQALEKYGLTQADVEREVEFQEAVLRFVDARFRPRIRIEEGSVERYYTEMLIPQLKTAGTQVPRLEEVAARIREVLVQQRINEELASWLKTLREQSTIKIH